MPDSSNKTYFVKTHALLKSWKPRIAEHLLEHLVHILDSPPDIHETVLDFMCLPLRRLDFFHLLKYLLRRQIPPFHRSRVNIHTLYLALRGQVEGWVADEESKEHFRKIISGLEERGPLLLDLPDSDAEGKARSEDSQKKNNNILFAPDESMAMSVFGKARKVVTKHLYSRACLVADDDIHPEFRNETLFWTVTVKASVLLIVLDFSNHYVSSNNVHQRPAIYDLVLESNWILATVGDLIWMYELFNRWTKKQDQKAKQAEELALPLLRANPIFLMADPGKRILEFPDDVKAQEQMFFFLATCSHAYRKYLIESLFTLRKSDTPWQNYERASAWIGFLQEQVLSWLDGFVPFKNKANRNELKEIKFFFKQVISLWLSQTIVTGLSLLDTKDCFMDTKTKETITMPIPLRKVFNEKELDNVSAPAKKSWQYHNGMDSWAWVDMPTFPIDYTDRSIVLFTTLPSGLDHAIDVLNNYKS